MKIFFNHPKKSPAKLDFLSPISEKWTILKAPKNKKTRANVLKNEKWIKNFRTELTYALKKAKYAL